MIVMRELAEIFALHTISILRFWLPRSATRFTWHRLP
jgi:hypothetical protein